MLQSNAAIRVRYHSMDQHVVAFVPNLRNLFWKNTFRVRLIKLGSKTLANAVANINKQASFVYGKTSMHKVIPSIEH